MRKLSVWVSDREVGELRENPDSGAFDFLYFPGVPAQLAVSLTMPVDAPENEYEGFNRLPPPFEVSLPEGFILNAIRRKFAKMVDVDDDFALLGLVGRHTVGRVTFGGPIETNPDLGNQILSAARSKNASKMLTEILLAHPHTAGISGVMPKMSSGCANQTQRPGTAVTGDAIVKFDAPDFVGASLVEFACMTACKKAGLDVPEVTLSADASAITIQRFDMTKNGARLGFEDACALSGLARHGKYRGTVLDLFRMIERFIPTTQLPVARYDLLKRLLANDILRNGDAHLKNFGLVYEDPESPRLAPIYDVLTTPIWIHNDLPALRMGPDDDAQGWFGDSGFDHLSKIAKTPVSEITKLYSNMQNVIREAMQTVLDSSAAENSVHAKTALKRAVEILPSGLPGPCSICRQIPCVCDGGSASRPRN